jgi:hypothetical protein
VLTGPDHPVVADSLNNLANLYEDQARYADAEPLFKQSLAIREKALKSCAQQQGSRREATDAPTNNCDRGLTWVHETPHSFKMMAAARVSLPTSIIECSSTSLRISSPDLASEQSVARPFCITHDLSLVGGPVMTFVYRYCDHAEDSP